MSQARHKQQDVGELPLGHAFAAAGSRGGRAPGGGPLLRRGSPAGSPRAPSGSPLSHPQQQQQQPQQHDPWSFPAQYSPTAGDGVSLAFGGAAGGGAAAGNPQHGITPAGPPPLQSQGASPEMVNGVPRSGQLTSQPSASLPLNLQPLDTAELARSAQQRLAPIRTSPDYTRAAPAAGLHPGSRPPQAPQLSVAELAAIVQQAQQQPMPPGPPSQPRPQPYQQHDLQLQQLPLPQQRNERLPASWIPTSPGAQRWQQREQAKWQASHPGRIPPGLDLVLAHWSVLPQQSTLPPGLGPDPAVQSAAAALAGGPQQQQQQQPPPQQQQPQQGTAADAGADRQSPGARQTAEEAATPQSAPASKMPRVHRSQQLLTASPLDPWQAKCSFVLPRMHCM